MCSPPVASPAIRWRSCSTPSISITADMQAIAHEFNHPETVFIFAPGDPAHRARIRIFTPRRELPFAGHPTVGTAVLLGLRDGGGVGREIVLEEPIGAVHCTLETTANGGGRARFTIPQLPAEVGPVAEDAIIATALGLAPAEIGELRPARWSAGMPFTFVPVSSRAAVERCSPDLARFDSAFGAGGAAYVVLPPDRRARPWFSRPHVRARHGHPGRSGHRLRGRGLCRLARFALARRDASPSPSSKATRWDGRA